MDLNFLSYFLYKESKIQYFIAITNDKNKISAPRRRKKKKVIEIRLIFGIEK